MLICVVLDIYGEAFVIKFSNLTACSYAQFNENNGQFKYGYTESIKRDFAILSQILYI